MSGMSSRQMDIRCPAESAPRGPVIAAALLLFSLTLQCVDLRAELLFRSAQPTGGEQRWSDLKKYSDLSRSAHPQVRVNDASAAPEEVQVVVSGYITEEDVVGANVMADLLKSGKQKIAGNLVSFASDGGEVVAAMALGRLLHQLGVSTMVGRDDQCLSSCVFAFMGGDRRIAAGHIGIHRPYFASTRYVQDRRSQYRQLQKKLRDYIEELDFPPSLYEEVMAVSPEAIRVLSPADLKRFYLDGMSPSAEEEADAESARRLGVPILEYLQRKARACAGSQVEGCAQAAPSTAAADAPQRQDARVRTAEGALGLGPARSPKDSAPESRNPDRR